MKGNKEEKKKGKKGKRAKKRKRTGTLEYVSNPDNRLVSRSIGAWLQASDAEKKKERRKEREEGHLIVDHFVRRRSPSLEPQPLPGLSQVTRREGGGERKRGRKGKKGRRSTPSHRELFRVAVRVLLFNRWAPSEPKGKGRGGEKKKGKGKKGYDK